MIKREHRFFAELIRVVLFSSAIVSILISGGIIVVLGSQALLFFRDPNVSLIEFFLSGQWQPLIGRFGIAPLISATVMTSLFAMLIAIPIGYAVAVYLSEYAPPTLRAIIKPALEVLAGIPTVAYGYFALTFTTPLLQGIFGSDRVDFYNTASAGLTIGILILPLVTSMIEDALGSIPASLREASLALGATRMETSLRIVTPAALSGIAAACIVSLSRAIGETMIVALAAGAGPNLTLNPFEGAETLTGYIARISGGDIAYDTPDYNSIFALGLVLFAITLILNVISRRITRRFREEYD